MTEPKFTKGPWTIRDSIGCDVLRIYSEGDYGIGEAWDINGRPENAANARLIAAAPQMYHSCVDLVAALEEALAALNGAPNTQGLHSQIEAALRAGKAAFSAANGEG